MKVYLDANHIADDLLSNILSRATKLTLLNIDSRTTTTLNNRELGIFIRNNYGLWMSDNPHVSLYNLESPCFPDNLSATVIKMMHIKLNKYGLRTPCPGPISEVKKSVQ